MNTTEINALKEQMTSHMEDQNQKLVASEAEAQNLDQKEKNE